MKEPESGLTNIELSDNMITVHFIGQFNLSGAEAAHKRNKDVIEPLNEVGFFLIIDLTELEGGTPEAWEARDHFNAWLHEQNLLGKAVVVSSNFVEKVMESRLPSRQSEEKHIFHSVAEAIGWIQSVKGS